MNNEERRIAGVDEVGRGPLAGPVVAAAVILDPAKPIHGLADSKQLTGRYRERLAELIREHALAWALGRAEVAEIDRINILQASLLAMQRAVEALVDCAPSGAGGRQSVAPAELSAEAIVGGDARWRRSAPPPSSPRWRGIGRWSSWTARILVMVWRNTRAILPNNISRPCNAWG